METLAWCGQGIRAPLGPLLRVPHPDNIGQHSCTCTAKGEVTDGTARHKREGGGGQDRMAMSTAILHRSKSATGSSACGTNQLIAPLIIDSQCLLQTEKLNSLAGKSVLQ